MHGVEQAEKNYFILEASFHQTSLLEIHPTGIGERMQIIGRL